MLRFFFLKHGDGSPEPPDAKRSYSPLILLWLVAGNDD
jgi:hypothetical protein